jgi:hypothetical protein
VHDSRAGGHASPPHMGRFAVLIRENLVSLRPAYAPWRDGGKELSGRPGSSCACGIRAS